MFVYCMTNQQVRILGARACLPGMTVPCLILLCITMVVGWMLMPYVALAKTTLLLYTVASVPRTV